MEVISQQAAENAEAVSLADEAVTLIQTAIRRRKGRQNFMKLLLIARCVKIVTKYSASTVTRWQKE